MIFGRRKLSTYPTRAASQIDPTEDLGGVTLIGHHIPWLIQMDFHMLVRLASYILATPPPTFVSLFQLLSLLYFILTIFLLIGVQIIQPNEPYCSIYNDITNSSKAKYRKGSEPAIVDYVAVDTKSKNHLQKVCISSHRGHIFQWYRLLDRHIDSYKL